MDLFSVSEHDTQEIYKLYKTDRDKIDRDVAILQEWLRTQPHLPQKFHPILPMSTFFERALSHCAFKVELAKDRIEKYFTNKNKYKEMFDGFTDRNFVMPSQNCVVCFPLPKLGPGMQRYRVGTIMDTNLDKFRFDELIQMFLFNFEMAGCFEKIIRSVVIIDCKGAGTELVKKIEVSKLIKIITLIHEAYTTRVYGIHLVNPSTAIKFVISIARSAVGGVLFGRIHTHETMESLHEMVPKECLPTEFGGEAGPMSHYIKKLDELAVETRDYMRETVKYATDESKRIQKNECSEISTFGVDIFF